VSAFPKEVPPFLLRPMICLDYYYITKKLLLKNSEFGWLKIIVKSEAQKVKFKE